MNFIKFALFLVLFVGWGRTFWIVIFDRPNYMKTWNVFSVGMIVTNILCFFAMLMLAAYAKA